MTGPQSTYLNFVKGEEWNKAVRKAARLVANYWKEEGENIEQYQAESIAISILGLLKRKYSLKNNK